uniref:Prohibitin n=1 Tax=Nannospalax galili TaxID=1026970 RepID=A0A8C6RRN5_NANGA
MAQNLKDLAGCLPARPRGMGMALKLLLGAGAEAYGVRGHRATLFNRIGGVQQDTILAEGLPFRMPWFQYSTVYDIRARPRKISSSTGSKDLQTVTISLRVLSPPNAQELPSMYQHLGLDYDEQVLPSVVNEVLKSVVAKFNTLQGRGLPEQLSFSRECTAAVEAKQVAQQEAQRAQLLAEKAKEEQRQKIVWAEGEVQAAKMLGGALSKNPPSARIRLHQAAQNISKKINRIYLIADNFVLILQDESFPQGSESLIKGKK